MSKNIFGLQGLLANLGDIGQWQVQSSPAAFVDLTLAALPKTRPLVLVLADEKRQQIWYQRLIASRVDLQVAYLPLCSWWGQAADESHSLRLWQRLHSLACLDKPLILVTTLAGLLQHSMSLADYQAQSLTLHSGMALQQEFLLERLVELGYSQVGRLRHEGEFVWRGGVVDVAFNSQSGWRLEFFADDLASMQEFAFEEQRSSKEVNTVVLGPFCDYLVAPAERKAAAQALHEELIKQQVARGEREALVDGLLAGQVDSAIAPFIPLWEKRDSFFKYLENPFYVFPDSLAKSLANTKELLSELQRGDLELREERRPSLSPEQHFASLDDFLASLSGVGSLDFGEEVRPDAEVLIYQGTSSLKIKGLVGRLRGSRPSEIIVQLSREDLSATFVCPDLGLYRLWQEVRGDKEESERGLLDDVNASLVLGRLSEEYYWDEEAAHLYLQVPELKRRRKDARQSLKQALAFLAQLEVGDHVVHRDHGIGIYQGLHSLELNGYKADFLRIAYRGQDRVYLPVERLALLQKYLGGSGAVSLDALRSPAWQKRKAKTSRAVEDIAASLLELNAKRKLSQGLSYPESAGSLYSEMVEDFPHEESADQLQALEEIEADFRGAKLMDRLLVGDVGFGKTEVALRAAMRTILAGYQVLFLTPTTLLSMQQYRTCVQRLSPYGVTVGELSRFVVDGERRESLEGFNSGALDMVVGTHLLFSKKLKPPKLGLVIIDEEHRFGVKQKETLKKLRTQAGVLSLSATPIPRSLHMALLGLRDLSLLRQAPVERLAVRTTVGEFDAEVLEQALSFELKRGGQVFVVFNRIEGLNEVAEQLRPLLPRDSLRQVHGQLPAKQFRKIVDDFRAQRFRVLLCTDIIESGLHMPNVNTLIVWDSQRYGISQLHQLRGRVGRGAVQAYAYFFYRENSTEMAEARLELLHKHQKLGSGLSLAQGDLELRGAGNLLGSQQTGHWEAVGFSMYSEMLEQSMAKLRGQVEEVKSDIEIKLPYDFRIPIAYIADEVERLQVYRQIYGAVEREQLDEQALVLRDRYGVLPAVTQALFVLSKLKLSLQTLKVKRLSVSRADVWLLSGDFKLNSKRFRVVAGGAELVFGGGEAESSLLARLSLLDQELLSSLSS